VILPALSVGAEAEAFVKLNTARQKLSQADVFAGMLAAGDAEAVRVDAIMRETGWRMVRQNNSAVWKPGDLQCAPRLAKLVKAHGEAAVRNALATLREAFPNQVVRSSARTIEALVRIFARDLLAGIDPDCLVDALKAYETPEEIVVEASDMSLGNPALSWVDALTEVLLAEARELAAEIAA